MINTITIAGNLTNDVEVKKYGDDKHLGNFSVAVNDRLRSDDSVYFFSCVIFNENLLKSIKEYLVKGQKVAVTGKMCQNFYERDGKKLSNWTVSVNDIELCGKKDDWK